MLFAISCNTAPTSLSLVKSKMPSPSALSLLRGITTTLPFNFSFLSAWLIVTDTASGIPPKGYSAKILSGSSRTAVVCLASKTNSGFPDADLSSLYPVFGGGSSLSNLVLALSRFTASGPPSKTPSCFSVNPVKASDRPVVGIVSSS